MTIYFAGSIRGGRDDRARYADIVAILRQHGKVLTEHVADSELSSYGEAQLNDSEIFHRDMAWLEQADVVVAEVTTPSLGVGYELARAEVAGKPVLSLFSEATGRPLSAMVAGNKRLTIVRYRTLAEAKRAISEFLAAPRPS